SKSLTFLLEQQLKSQSSYNMAKTRSVSIESHCKDFMSWQDLINSITVYQILEIQLAIKCYIISLIPLPEKLMYLIFTAPRNLKFISFHFNLIQISILSISQ